jgi:hypothetical protein
MRSWSSSARILALLLLNLPADVTAFAAITAGPGGFPIGVVGFAWSFERHRGVLWFDRWGAKNPTMTIQGQRRFCIV